MHKARTSGRPWLTGRQVNAALLWLIVTALVTDLASWALPDHSNGWLTCLHAICGLTIITLLPVKIRGPVRRGMRRTSWIRWVSGPGIIAPPAELTHKVPRV